jgi:hypothetical protein
MELQDLLYGVSIQSLIGKPNQEVDALAFDSRLVNQNTLFLRLKVLLLMVMNISSKPSILEQP